MFTADHRNFAKVFTSQAIINVHVFDRVKQKSKQKMFSTVLNRTHTVGTLSTYVPCTVIYGKFESSL